MYVASLMSGYDDAPPAPNARYFPHLLRPDLQPLPPPPPSPPQPTTSSPGAITPTPTRRARGRPPGSKNKPKAPILVTRDAPNSLRSHVLEFASGTDILLSLSNYARLRGRGLSVLSGSGTVSDVSIRQPGGASLTLRGKFEILSLTGTVLPPPAPPGSGGIAIFMAGGHGQVVGGSAAGRLVAAGTVVLMAASFANAVFERLPVTEEVEEGGGEGQVQTASQSSGVTGSGGGSGSGLIGVVGGSRNGNTNVGNLPFGGELLGGWGGSHQF